MLIYLGPVLQRKVLSTLHYALKPSGFLILGPSESIGNHTDLFAPLNRKQRFYQARLSAAS